MAAKYKMENMNLFCFARISTISTKFDKNREQSNNQIVIIIIIIIIFLEAYSLKAIVCLFVLSRMLFRFSLLAI